MARQIAPHGRLRRHLPLDEPWRRSDRFRVLLTSRTPSPQQLEMLVDTYRIAEGIARQAAEAAGRRRLIRSPLLFTRDPLCRRWRRRTVPLLAALIGQTEGEA
jgi:hypothetical protein